MGAPSSVKVAKAKEAIRTALEAFRASCRSRQARYLALLRELAKEHDRDANELHRADRKFIRDIDPEHRVRLAMHSDELFVNWSPGTVEIPDRDDVGDTVPGGDIHDALDDVDSMLAEAKTLYANDEG